MKYKIINEVKEANYEVYINGHTAQDGFHFRYSTPRKGLEIISVTYENESVKKDHITVPVFKEYEDNIFSIIEKDMQAGKYDKLSDFKIKMEFLMPGCIIHLKVPEYYKYNARSKRYDIRTEKYSFFAYDIDDTELFADISGKLQRIVEPNLV